MALDPWAGHVPVRRVTGAPLPDPKLRKGIAMAGFVAAFLL